MSSSNVLTDTSVMKSGDVRVFVQADGISPGSGYLYYGCVSLAGPEQDLGEPDPVYCPSPSLRNTWDIIDEIPKTQALGTTDFTQRADRFLRDVWWDLKQKGCVFNIQAVIGRCQRPDDFTQWDAKLLLSNTRLTKIGLGEMNALSGDDNAVVDLTGSLSFREFAPIRSLTFGEVAGSTVVAEVLDGLYFDAASCGECGLPSDGCNKLYFLTAANPGSPGLSSQIVYSLDGGLTWSTMDISVLGGLSGNRIAVVQAYLVVVSQAKGGHAYAPFTSIDAGTLNWSLVTSGYVAGKSPRAIYSKASNETFVTAQGGYIYKMTDPALPVTVLTDGSVSTQDQNDIAGSGRTVVSVGANNSVLKSDNAGETWTLVTGPVPGANLTAVWCMSKLIWFVGTGSGTLWYTINGGTSWTQLAFGSATVINDIKFYNDTVGYMATEVAGAARVYRTTDSGHTWQYQAPAISGLPTALRCNVVAPCNWNKVAVGGIKTVGGDGLIAIAE